MLLKTCFVFSLVLWAGTIHAGVLQRSEASKSFGEGQKAPKPTETRTLNLMKAANEEQTEQLVEGESGPRMLATTPDEGATMELTVINENLSDEADAIDITTTTTPVEFMTVKVENSNNTNENNAKLMRSAKLLLLSTPKLHERPQQEEKDAEAESEAAESSDLAMAAETDSTTTADNVDFTKKVTSQKYFEGIKRAQSTKLISVKNESPRPIDAAAKISENVLLLAPDVDNDDAFDEGSGRSSFQKQHEEEEAGAQHRAVHTKATLNKLNKKDTVEASSGSNIEANSKQNSTNCNSTAIVDWMAMTPNDNIAASVNIEAETTDDDFVIFDDIGHEHHHIVAHDELNDANAEYIEGSFTHVDSAEHLQPIVQSVEIVPISLDKKVIVNYVGTWEAS